MLQVNAKFSFPEFDADAWTKTLDKEMGVILRGAVKVWLRTVLRTVSGAPHTVGDSFPIQTGRAKASLRPIARMVRVAIPIRPAKGRPDLTSRGESSSQFSILDDKTAPKTYEYRFSWGTDLEHFIWNEFNYSSRVISKTPWKVTVAANLAARLYIRQDVKKRLSGSLRPSIYFRTRS